ncbi:MAG TPA: hypothetical protein VHB77_12300, partial [Planctomycetaceae bacterium]|nr:hypothetical protein [Planctomycetaceae bacterium]
EHEGNRAVRVGDWKLVAKGPAARWELYDLRADRTELQDLSQEQPERVKELVAKWEAWAHRAQVLPWIWKPQYGEPALADDGPQRGSAKKRFELKGDATLPRGKAPNAVDKALKITVKISESAPDGVLVAQGGTANGFTLYLKAGQLTFAVRRHNAISSVSAKEPLPAGPVEVTAELSNRGEVTLKANQQTLGSGKVDGLVVEHAVEGLQVGRDTGGAVGDYTTPFKFGGKIDRVLIELPQP